MSTLTNMTDVASDRAILEGIIAEQMKLFPNATDKLAWLNEPEFGEVREFLYSPQNYPQLDRPSAGKAAYALLSFYCGGLTNFVSQKEVRGVRVPIEAVAAAAISVLNDFRQTLLNAKTFQMVPTGLEGSLRKEILSYVS